MSQSRPASREELKKYCLVELGYPVIKVNVDDVQLENCVDKTLQFYQEFHSAGTERSYLKHQVTAELGAEGQGPPEQRGCLFVTAKMRMDRPVDA